MTTFYYKRHSSSIKGNMQTPWFNHLSDALAELDLSVVDPTSSPGLSREVIYSKLELQYKQEIFTAVGNTAKLGVLKTCKLAHSRSSYLKAVTIPAHRIALTRLRTSSHYLEIEQGRHHRNPPERSA